MKYTVLWKPMAESQLASIWASAADRAAVSSAADQIDKALRFDPETRGEARSGSTRFLIVLPLAATFDVNEDDRIVQVLALRRIPERSR